MSNTFIYSTGTKQTMVNNNIVEDLAYKAQYDGNNGEMVFRNKNEAYYVKVDNDDLQEILSERTDNVSLENKLQNLLKNKNTKKRTVKKTPSRTRKSKTKKRKSKSKSKSKTKTKTKTKTKSTRRKSPKTSNLLDTLF